MYDKHLTIICWLVPKALGIGNIYSTEQEQHKFVEATKEEDASRFYINVTGCVVWCGVESPHWEPNQQKGSKNI